MFSGLMSQWMTFLACAMNRVSICRVGEDWMIKCVLLGTAYYDDRNSERVFEAQGTILLDVFAQIYPAQLHAQVSLAVYSTPSVQLRNTRYAVENFVYRSLRFYRSRFSKFDESITIVFHVVSAKNRYEMVRGSA